MAATSNDAINGNRKRSHGIEFDLMEGPVNLKATPPYDLHKEQVPNSVLLSKEWADFEKGKRYILNLLMEPLSKANSNDKSIPGLIDFVKERLENEKSEKIILCLSGQMGTGKSSTLNSLFGVGPVAREGDFGESVTLASCMYLAAKKDQESPFVAEVKLFNSKERRQILTDYVDAYYRATYGEGEDENAGTDAQTSGAHSEENTDIRDEVASLLVELFANHPECSSKEAVQQFLDGARSSDDESILGPLFDWCDRIVHRATGGKPVITVSASTAGDLSNKLENFTAHAVDDDGNLAMSLTPLVSLIKIYFNSPLTNLGIVFLDTPGTSDINRVRKRSAIKHRQRMTHCAVFSNAARAKDDSEISRAVKLMRHRGDGKSVIVITKNDDLKSTPTGSGKDREVAAMLQKIFKRIENQINVKDIELEAADEDDTDTYGRLSKEKKVLEIRLKLVDNAEKSHRIKMRNVNNQRAIEDKIKHVSLTPVPIFPISNTEYERHTRGFAAKNIPVLNVEDTKIPDLRRLISTFPNEARLNELKHQQEANIPGLLSRMGLYTARTPSDRKADMEEHVQMPLKKYKTKIEGVFQILGNAIEGLILNPMKSKQAAWARQAESLCDSWCAEFKTSVFLRLMNRNGHRKGSIKVPELDLSADLVRASSDDLTALFKKILSEHHKFRMYLEEDIVALIPDMQQNMKEDSNEPFMVLEPFYKFLEPEKRAVSRCIREVSERVLHRIDEIQRKVLFGDEDSYLVGAMDPIYAAVRQLKGGKHQTKPKPPGGWPAHRKLVFKSEVTKLDGIYASVYEGVKSEFNTILNEEKQALIESVGKVFEGVQLGFDMMCDAEEFNDPHELDFRNELTANLEEAEKHLRGPMQSAYEALQKDFRRVGVAAQ